jgi:hypothetical protein
MDTTPKPWMQDKVHVINSAGIYRAHPPTKVVQQKQDICWEAFDKELELAPQPQLDNYRYNDTRTQVTATVVAPAGSYFEYVLKCDGQEVQGNSPPVVVVDTP